MEINSNNVFKNEILGLNKKENLNEKVKSGGILMLNGTTSQRNLH